MAGPWEKFQQQPAEGPWTKFGGSTEAPSQQDATKWREPGMLVPIQFSEDGQFRWATPQIVTETIKAIEGPGKALQGEYGMQHVPGYGYTTVTDEMIGDAVGGAGFGLTTLSPAAAAGAQFGRMAIPAPANRMVQRSLMADNVPVSEIGPRLSAMGPGAVVADLGPNLQARAAAIATAPGNGAKTIVDTLAARRAGSNARIMGGVDEALGPAPIPSRMAAENAASKQALGPQYEALFASPGVRAVDSSPIALNLDSLVVNERGAAQSAARKVREMLNVAGGAELDPNPYTLFKTRQAIDGLMATEADPGAIRILSQTRNQVDDLLAQSVPGIKEVDAQFAELARQGDATQVGQQLLDTGRTAPRPADVEELMTSGALPQGAQIGPSAVPLRLREGARAEIDRIIGTNVRDINAMKRIVAGEGNWNREKLASVFGEEKAAKLLQILEREAAFNATEQLALQGSRTQVLKAAQDDIFGTGPKPNPVRSAANLKFGDALADTADRLLGGIYSAKRGGNNEALARALMMAADDFPAPEGVPPRKLGLALLQAGGGLNSLRMLAQQP